MTLECSPLRNLIYLRNFADTRAGREGNSPGRQFESISEPRDLKMGSVHLTFGLFSSLLQPRTFRSDIGNEPESEIGFDYYAAIILTALRVR